MGCDTYAVVFAGLTLNQVNLDCVGGPEPEALVAEGESESRFAAWLAANKNYKNLTIIKIDSYSDQSVDQTYIGFVLTPYCDINYYEGSVDEANRIVSWDTRWKSLLNKLEALFGKPPRIVFAITMS